MSTFRSIPIHKPRGVSLAGAATTIIFVSTKVDNFCRGKHSFVETKDVFCRDKHVFVATKLILVAAPATDSVFFGLARLWPMETFSSPN